MLGSKNKQGFFQPCAPPSWQADAHRFSVPIYSILSALLCFNSNAAHWMYDETMMNNDEHIWHKGTMQLLPSEYSLLFSVVR